MTSDIFSIYPGLMAVTFGGAGLICSALCAGTFIPMLRRTAELSDNVDVSTTDAPKVSVIVYSHNAAQALPDIIHSLAIQDYPDFEIIVVDDGSTDNSADILERLATEEPRLHHTFVPENSINLSRRKLALTLGIKAATGKIILTTDATCSICSDKWIALMTRHFNNPATDLVLGYAAPTESRSPGRLYRTFDFTMTSAQWLASATSGHPFRGDSRNMAYRRDIFFEHKGFGSNIWTHYGEDDLFISDFANGSNTTVEASSLAMIHLSAESCGHKAWSASKERHYFTSCYLHTSAHRRNSVGGWLLWIATVFLAASALTGLPSPYTLASAILLAGLLYSILIVSYRSAQKRLDTGHLALTIIPFFYLKPITDALKALKFNGRRKQNFTWQR